MTGRLLTLGRILSIYGADLNDTNSTEQERNVAVLLGAVSAAILLDATGTLAAMVAPWWDGEAEEALKEMVGQREASKR